MPHKRRYKLNAPLATPQSVGLSKWRASPLTKGAATATVSPAGHFSGDWTTVSVTKAWHAISTEVVYHSTAAKYIFTPRAYAWRCFLVILASSL